MLQNKHLSSRQRRGSLASLQDHLLPGSPFASSLLPSPPRGGKGRRRQGDHGGRCGSNNNNSNRTQASQGPMTHRLIGPLNCRSRPYSGSAPVPSTLSIGAATGGCSWRLPTKALGGMARDQGRQLLLSCPDSRPTLTTSGRSYESATSPQKAMLFEK